MRKRLLPSLALLVVAANLLAPQRIVSYSACCYGEDGRLKAGISCCGLSAPEDAKAGFLYQHRPCCDPKVQELRGPASPALESAPVLTAERLLGAAFAAGSPVLAPVAAGYPEPLDIPYTSPPFHLTVLQLQPRLNL